MGNTRLVDMTGQKHWRWTVIKKNGNQKAGAALWLCVCECGRESTVSGANLRSGQSKQCKPCATSIKNMTHGLSETRLYRIYRAMKNRCYNKKFHKYKTYGAKGITICDEWNDDFKLFHDWSMSSGYSENLSIDRIENEKGYSPENCRWATAQTQSENREFVSKNQDGELWWHIAQSNNITQAAYRSRLNDGWTHQDAATKPMRYRKHPI